MKNKLINISNLFNKHHKKFPPGLAGEEIEGVELVLLDSDTVGIIGRFLGRKHNLGKLDDKWHLILKQLKEESELIHGKIPTHGIEYFQEVHQLICLTLDYLEEKSNL